MQSQFATSNMDFRARMANRRGNQRGVTVRRCGVFALLCVGIFIYVTFAIRTTDSVISESNSKSVTQKDAPNSVAEVLTPVQKEEKPPQQLKPVPDPVVKPADVIASPPVSSPPAKPQEQTKVESPPVANVEATPKIVESSNGSTSSGSQHSGSSCVKNKRAERPWKECGLEENTWLSQMGSKRTVICDDGSLVMYMDEWFIARAVVLDATKAAGRRGGEKVEDVLGQRESDEYFRVEKGFIKLTGCAGGVHMPSVTIKHHVGVWKDTIVTEKIDNINVDVVNKGTWLAIQRYEYANLFHQLTDFYMAYTSVRFFGLEPRDVNVLLVDAHPEGPLDMVWDHLFANMTRFGDYRHSVPVPRIYFPDELVLVPQGYASPFKAHRMSVASIPMLEEYRQHTWESVGLDIGQFETGCMQQITVVLRHDYLAHPRHRRQIERKISNEENLMQGIRDALKGSGVEYKVVGVVLEEMSYAEQVALSAKTAVMIGMHGAGLSHIVLTPPRSGLVEIWPTYVTGRYHFDNMARARSLPYRLVRVTDRSAEDMQRKSSHVPVGEIARAVRSILKELQCPA